MSDADNPEPESPEPESGDLIDLTIAKLKGRMESAEAGVSDALAHLDRQADRPEVADKLDDLSKRYAALQERVAGFAEQAQEVEEGQADGQMLAAMAERYCDILLSGEFDAAAYLAAHPGVARSGEDPLRHYLRTLPPETVDET